MALTIIALLLFLAMVIAWVVLPGSVMALPIEESADPRQGPAWRARRRTAGLAVDEALAGFLAGPTQPCQRQRGTRRCGDAR